MTPLLVDLGGTRMKTSAGPPVEHGGDWLPAVRAAVAAADAEEVALCVPGIVDGGRVVSLPGKLPGIVGADLPALLDVPVRVLTNDAHAYGLGEAVSGAGRGFSRVVVVTLGTGVGVAVLEDGAVLGRGPFGGGLLGGQLPIAATGGVDTAGRNGTIEALCRADALELSGMSQYRADLVRALTALALAHAPDCIVVGGGAAGPQLLEGVQQAVQAGLWPGQSVEVRLAELGDAAALHGLAALLRTPVTT